ncbi:MAG: type II toxin-antitoxin system RelE/ParE family toxin [Aureispira sp.]|nr:type II toxin-antitoxin system RelE/ParE family toxin [Aureispira sp.]
MNITFNNKKLETYANDESKGKKKLGARRFELYKQRIDQLLFASTLEDLRYTPGKYHALKENRKGQWACSLDGAYRLIFEPHENPIPENEDGQYLWIEIKGVEVIEIVNYHSK